MIKKVIAGALLLTIGTTTAFACGGHHGGGHHGYRNYSYRPYNYSYSRCYNDANHDGVCDYCHYYRGGHSGYGYCIH